VAEAIEPGSLVHPDGWHGYDRLKLNGSRQQVTFIRGHDALASELLPRVHRVVSLLKRWLLGTHQGAVNHAHLDDYLDEFTFRFNRRRSRHRGKLVYRLVQQAVAVEPAPYQSLVKGIRRRARRHRNMSWRPESSGNQYSRYSSVVTPCQRGASPASVRRRTCTTGC
jgi:transposase-like protein